MQVISMCASALTHSFGHLLIQILSGPKGIFVSFAINRKILTLCNKLLLSIISLTSIELTFQTSDVCYSFCTAFGHSKNLSNQSNMRTGECSFC